MNVLQRCRKFQGNILDFATHREPQAYDPICAPKGVRSRGE
ncbi:MAG: hypothetical protein V3U23_03355 [Kiloniellales bacterium]